MWLDRRRALLEGDRELTILVGGAEFGVGDLIGDLRGGAAPLLWAEFTSEDAGDSYAQADRVADALRRDLVRDPVPLGMPFEFILRTVAQVAQRLAPVVLAFSGIEHVPEVVPALLRLRPTGARLVLAFTSIPEGVVLPSDVLILSRQALALTEQEAYALAAERVAREEVPRLLDASDGAVITFLSHLAERRVEPPPMTQGPEGPRALQRDAPTLSDEALLAVLVRRHRHREALTLACLRLPDRVPGIIVAAGHYFHEHGLHQQLHRLLSSLPEPLLQDASVLFWLLVAAFRLGRHEELRPRVEAYLLRYAAPDLRAAYAAGLADSGHRMSEVRRAYGEGRTVYTSFQLAHITSDLDEAIRVIEADLHLAERGRPYELARVAGLYSWRLRETGDYPGAAHWGRYALDQFDEHGFGDFARRLRIVNDWAYARLLTGRIAGLAQVLSESEALLDDVDDGLARRFRSTLADVLFVSEQVERALELYERNVRTAPRHDLGVYSFHLVRALVEVGSDELATDQAEFAFSVTRGLDNPLHHAYAQLALGLARLGGDPLRAQRPLSDALRFFRSKRNADYEARATLYLARFHLERGDEARAEQLLKEGANSLAKLSPSGLKLLAGPARAFADVFSLLTTHEAQLEFYLLGRREVWLDGRPLGLSALHLEIVALLAIRRRPLTLEELLDEFTAPAYTRASLKSELSRLRKVVPVSNHPYKLALPFVADFDTLQAHLERGELQSALALYRGELLPGSQVASLREYGAYLLEALRQAVIADRNLEGCLQLLDTNPDDLELLELALELAGKGDPRRPLVQAQATLLRREWGL